MQARDAQKLKELATAHTANLQAACAAARASGGGAAAPADAATMAYRAEYEDIMRGRRQAAAAASGLSQVGNSQEHLAMSTLVC